LVRNLGVVPVTEMPRPTETLMAPRKVPPDIKRPQVSHQRGPKTRSLGSLWATKGQPMPSTLQQAASESLKEAKMGDKIKRFHQINKTTAEKLRKT
jgi:hypothetical protein